MQATLEISCYFLNEVSLLSSLNAYQEHLSLSADQMLNNFYNQKSINGLPIVTDKKTSQRPVFNFNILLSYENGNCPAFSIANRT